MLIDTHAHLDYHLFDEDREAMIERAWTAGFEAIVTIGISPESCRRAIALAERYDRVWAAVALHPTDAIKRQESTLEELEQWAKHEKVVAIGETGLDYYWPDSPRDVQQSLFRDTVRLACRNDLPVIIHNREAGEDILSILEEEKRMDGQENLRGIMHCFSGDASMMKRSLALDFYISFAGNLTYKNSALREVAAVVPEERLLVESDAPFLPPVPFRGKRNETAYVCHTAEFLAKVRGSSYDDLARATTSNARRILELP